MSETIEVVVKLRIPKDILRDDLTNGELADMILETLETELDDLEMEAELLEVSEWKD